MKKPKVTKKYVFNGISHQGMVDELNSKYPIDLRYNANLVNKVYARYPLVDKTCISIVVKSVFQSFRDLLVLGKVLNFNNLFFDTKLFFFKHRRNGHILPSLKVKISTPPPLRKI